MLYAQIISFIYETNVRTDQQISQTKEKQIWGKSYKET